MNTDPRTSALWQLKIPCILVLAFVSLPSAAPQGKPATRQVPVESLIYDLKNPDPVRRREAARLLGENKIQSATKDLVAAASDADPAVRREIVIALDKIGDLAAVPAFVKLSADTDAGIRERAIEGLVDLYVPREGGLVVTLNRVANFFNPWSDEWAEVVVQPGTKVAPEAASAMCDRLGDAQDGIRLKAARSLGILKAAAGVQPLLQVLGREQTNGVRFEAIRALRKIGEPSAAQALMNYIGYNDPKVRNEAIQTIGRLRYRPAVPEFMRLFDKERSLPARLVDKTYCECLLDALACIADPAAQPLFVKEKQNPEDTMRLHAVEGLARLASKDLATEVSRDWLAEKQPRVKTAQAYALFRMGRREFLDEVVNGLGGRQTNAEARMLLLESTPGDLPELYAEVKNDDPNVREALAEIFGLIGDDRAIPVLQQLSQDRRGQVAAFATQAIRVINARMGR